ncbi:hypothetical protein BVG19_g2673 [[Candida] boidinii]|nr:hypothetical protein BVG19_g2673 [[Candida] boidinii]OWB51834.1 hypothetical protein B5S27_g3404 [[Candida] boidinii]
MTNQVLQDQLRRKLVELPQAFKFQNTKEFTESSMRLFHFALSNGGEYYKDIFPILDKPEFQNKISIPNSWDSIFLLIDPEYLAPSDLDSFQLNYSNIDDPHSRHSLLWSNEYFKGDKSHDHRICARRIGRFERVYNCLDCGVDETCCMCSYCFNKDQHKDHRVTSHASSGSSAICDCGDENSWKTKLICAASERQKTQNINTSIPEGLKNSIRVTIEVLWDYFIDVQILNCESLSKINNLSAAIGNEAYFFDILNERNLSELRYKKRDSKEDEYFLILWNDEFHNWEEAMNTIKNICSTHAETLAKHIDAYGRGVVGISKDFKTLFSKLKKINRDELTATICTSRDYSRDIICDNIVKFFTIILEHPTPSIRNFIRNTFSECLLSAYSPDLSGAENINSVNRLSYPYQTLASLTDNFRIPLWSGNQWQHNKGSFNQLTLKGIGAFKENRELEFDKNFIKPFPSNSRVQLLFYLQPRLWKYSRISLKNLLIPNLTSSSESREQLYLQIVPILPLLEKIESSEDREWKLSLLGYFRLQTYYDPHTCTKLLQTHSFSPILKSIVGLLKPHSDNTFFKYRGEQKYQASKAYVFNRQLETECEVLRGLSQLFEHINIGDVEILKFYLLTSLTAILLTFQEAYTIMRKTGEHVVNEDMGYRLYFTLALPLYAVIKRIGKAISGIEGKSEIVENAIIFVSSILAKNARGYGRNGRTRYDICYSPVSFLHPLHTLLSQIISNYKHFNLKEHQSLLTRVIEDIEFDSNEWSMEEFDFVKDTYTIDIGYDKSPPSFLAAVDNILDHFALSAQIASGFWVRNGSCMEDQLLNYKDELQRKQDLYLIQLSLMLSQTDSNTAFENIIYKYGILDCINGDKKLNETRYEEKIETVLNELIVFLYNILTCRTLFRRKFNNDSDSEEEDLENTIILLLTINGKSRFSKLKKQLGNLNNLEKLLLKVAQYTPPSESNQFGYYTAKSKFLTSIDPYDYNNGFESIDVLEESIYKALSDLKKKPIDEIVIKPFIDNIVDLEMLLSFTKLSDFFKTRTFAKFVYKLLNFVITSDNDQFLPALLHLLHAIVLDDDNIYKNKELLTKIKERKSNEIDTIDDYEETEERTHGLQSFIDIPVCNLLLSIIQKEDTPKRLVIKAQVILDSLLLRDDQVLESLISGFGEVCINEYKSSLKGKGSFETKKEKAKRLALKRQKKILAKMNKQQDMFIENNQKQYDENEEDKNKEQGTKKGLNDNEEDHGVATETSKPKEAPVCILCRNPPVVGELFGYVATISKSPLFWNIPLADKERSDIILDKNKDPCCFQNSRKRKRSSGEKNEIIPAKSLLGDSFGDLTVAKDIINSCGHTLHLKCWEKMIDGPPRDPKSFLAYSCPLCDSYCNTFIPSFKFSDSEFVKHEIVNRPTNFKNYDEFYANIRKNSDVNQDRLFKTVFDVKNHTIMATKTTVPFMKIKFQVYNTVLYNSRLINSIASLRDSNTRAFAVYSAATMIGNTIEGCEIASRYNELSRSDKESITKIVPVQTFKLIRALFQYRVLLQLTDKGTYDKMVYNYMRHFNNLSIVSEVLHYYTNGTESLNTYFTYIIMKRIIKVSLSLIYRYILDPENVAALDPTIKECEASVINANGDTQSDQTNIKVLRSVLKDLGSKVLLRSKKISKSIDTYLKDELVIKIYTILKSIMTRYYSQFKLLLVILFSNNPDIPICDIDTFCDKYNITSLDKIFAMISGTSGESEGKLFHDIYKNETEKIFRDISKSNQIVNTPNRLITKAGEQLINPLRIDYPCVVKLVNLPNKMSKFLEWIHEIDKNNSSKASTESKLETYYCLGCGNYSLSEKERGKHLFQCPILKNIVYRLDLVPESNSYRSKIIEIKNFTSSREVVLLSPYFNCHGEPAGGLIGLGESGELNKIRYDAMNIEWLNSSVYKKITRGINRFSGDGGAFRLVDLAFADELIYSDYSTKKILTEAILSKFAIEFAMKFGSYTRPEVMDGPCIPFDNTSAVNTDDLESDDEYLLERERVFLDHEENRSRNNYNPLNGEILDLFGQLYNRPGAPDNDPQQINEMFTRVLERQRAQGIPANNNPDLFEWAFNNGNDADSFGEDESDDDAAAQEADESDHDSMLDELQREQAFGVDRRRRVAVNENGQLVFEGGDDDDDDSDFDYYIDPDLDIDQYRGRPSDSEDERSLGDDIRDGNADAHHGDSDREIAYPVNHTGRIHFDPIEVYSDGESDAAEGNDAHNDDDDFGGELNEEGHQEGDDSSYDYEDDFEDFGGELQDEGEGSGSGGDYEEDHEDFGGDYSSFEDEVD